jgi:hypothetical protein
MSETNSVQSRRDMDQAAEDEGAAVLLDPVGRHQIHLAAEQRFQAIGQGMKPKPIGSAKLASRSTSLLAVASSVAKELNSWRLLSLNSEARAGKCSRSTANTSARLVQGWATEAGMAAAGLLAES